MSKVRSSSGIWDWNYNVRWFWDILCKNKDIRSVGNKIKLYGMWERTLDLYLRGLMSQIHYFCHSLRLYVAQEDEKGFWYGIPTISNGWIGILYLLLHLFCICLFSGKCKPVQMWLVWNVCSNVTRQYICTVCCKMLYVRYTYSGQFISYTYIMFMNGSLHQTWNHIVHSP